MTWLTESAVLTTDFWLALILYVIGGLWLYLNLVKDPNDPFKIAGFIVWLIL